MMLVTYCVYVCSGKSLMLEAGQVTEMLEGNVIAPYKFTKVRLLGRSHQEL